MNNNNKMSNQILDINTILHTKDGGYIGNAIVTGREGYYWEVTTDYGNKVRFTNEKIDEHFNIAWLNYSKDMNGYDCKEMQEMMSSDHKHRVEKPCCERCNGTGLSPDGKGYSDTPYVCPRCNGSGR
jgi:hypothetical protein